MTVTDQQSPFLPLSPYVDFPAGLHAPLDRDIGAKVAIGRSLPRGLAGAAHAH
jgi:hypothetical protein